MKAYHLKMESIGIDADLDKCKMVQETIDRARGTEAEAMIAKSIDSIADDGALYEALLKCDGKLKTMKVLNARDVLHPTLFKKFESVLG